MKKFYVKPKTETVSLEMEQNFMGASVRIEHQILVEEYKDYDFGSNKLEDGSFDISFQ